MIQFEWPWAILFLLLPWFIRRLMSPVNLHAEAALRVPFLKELSNMEQKTELRRKHPWPLWATLFIWLLLVLACMRPQWLGDLVEVPVSGRDLMLAVDLSGSMQETDFIINGEKVDRLTATKKVAGEFIDRRIGDRLGLILFGEQAYLQAPLTFDRKTVKTFLYEAAIGLAGKSTAIGDGIGLAVKRLRNNDGENKILILLTDGANTAGVVDPEDAAALAEKEGLKIYTIGIGADEMLVRSLFGTRRVNPSADLDELTLKNIADKTGGQYFRARDSEDLEKIYAIIDQLEPVEQDAERFRPRTALYFWPLAIAALLSAFMIILKLEHRW